MLCKQVLFVVVHLQVAPKRFASIQTEHRDRSTALHARRRPAPATGEHTPSNSSMIGTANAGLRQIVVIVEFFPSFSSSRSGPSKQQRQVERRRRSHVFVPSYYFVINLNVLSNDDIPLNIFSFVGMFNKTVRAPNYW